VSEHDGLSRLSGPDFDYVVSQCEFWASDGSEVCPQCASQPSLFFGGDSEDRGGQWLIGGFHASGFDFHDAECPCVIPADNIQFAQVSWCAPIHAEDFISRAG